MSARSALLVAALLLPCCSEQETITPVALGSAYEGTLAVEIRGSAAVSIATAPNGDVPVSVQPDMIGAAGLLDPSMKLSVPGRVEPFPETESELYTAKFSVPARNDGPCGASPMSLGLSLLRRGHNNHVGGSLTAYCGADRFSGVPARVLRLSGDLPKSAPGGAK